jgi:hypothetical protein
MAAYHNINEHMSESSVLASVTYIIPTTPLLQSASEEYRPRSPNVAEMSLDHSRVSSLAPNALQLSSQPSEQPTNIVNEGALNYEGLLSSFSCSYSDWGLLHSIWVSIVIPVHIDQKSYRSLSIVVISHHLIR